MARNVQIIDSAGNTRDWSWLAAKYGDVQIAEGQGDCYQVIRLLECTSGWMGFTCTMLNAGGGPVVGLKVAYDHSTPEQPAIDIAITGGDGVAEHTAGGGEMYDPRTHKGPVTWYALEVASDKLSGIGWLYGTNHTHLQVTFQWQGGGGDDGDLVAAVYELARQVGRIADNLP